LKSTKQRVKTEPGMPPTIVSPNDEARLMVEQLEIAITQLTQQVQSLEKERRFEWDLQARREKDIAPLPPPPPPPPPPSSFASLSSSLSALPPRPTRDDDLWVDELTHHLKQSVFLGE
jgi:hypothetical protein